VALTSEKSSDDGLAWAWASFFLDVFESLVLVQIIFFDKLDLGVPLHWGFLEIYLVATLFMSLGQLAGIALVTRGYYLLGGYLQIISSGGQVLKVDGIFGVVGGLKALRYGRSLTAP
jgi:hypothetical protein